MATAVLSDSAPVLAASQPTVLFSYRAEKDGRTVADMFCLEEESLTADVVVVAEIRPTHARDDSELLRQVRAFPTSKQARRFVDEAMIALEYLGSIVSKTSRP